MAQYRTAQGKMVDMASLASKHEKVRAVGNMNVNARGDIIDGHNRVINDVNQRVNTMYKKTMENRVAARPNRPTPPPAPVQDPAEHLMPPDIDNEDDFDADRIAKEKAEAAATAKRKK